MAFLDYDGLAYWYSKILTRFKQTHERIDNVEKTITTDTASKEHNHTISDVTDFPSSMPASDVYSWAKAETKPIYSWDELENKPTELAASDVHDWAKEATKPTYDYTEITNLTSANVDYANRAKADVNGNDISTTYKTKAESVNVLVQEDAPTDDSAVWIW